MFVSNLAALLHDIVKSQEGDLRTDIFTFRGTMPTGGSAITQPTVINSRQTHDIFVTRIKMGLTTPATNPSDLDNIRWNCEVSGVAQNMFKSDVEVAAYVGQPGTNAGVPTGEIDFSPGGFAIRAGADLSVTLTQRANLSTQRVVTIAFQVILAPKGMAARLRPTMQFAPTAARA